MRTKDEKLHARRKREISAAASACFAAKGVRQTTMQEICAAAGISAGGLYRYFASKEDIIAEIAAEEAEKDRELAAHLKAAPNLLRGLHAALPAVVADITEPAYGRLALDFAAEATRNPEVGRPFLDSEAAFAEELAALIRQDQETGVVEPELDPEAMAFVIRCLLDGLAANGAFPVPVSRRRLVAALRHTLAAALKAPS